MKRAAGVDTAHHEIMQLLRVANYQAFKIWRLVRGLRVPAWFLLGTLVLATSWACYRWRNFPLVTPEGIGIAASVAAGTALLGSRLMKLIRYKDTAERIGISVGRGMVGWLPALIHILVFDRLYLRRGRLSRIAAIKE